MSHLVQAKTAAFAAKLEERAQNPEFLARQAEHERLTASANSDLTALLASHKAAGTVPSQDEVNAFPSLGESPLEVLSREIYEEISQ